ncbi:very short patch repair endonuclease [Roseomonas mucosa]|uniref:very short patch repair endonuclease n=1 Tax=Roseomonas mucosa TaxID=207340 RepID=UPI002B40F575|nr:very short patch repair endonuclease [Roseomonas mucosa]
MAKSPASRTPFPDVAPSRRRNMAAIKRKNTKPEKLVRSTLHQLGYRFRVDASDLPGRPDLVFPRKKIAIFVHGCFWHNHGACSAGRVPATRREYWAPKLLRNSERDTRNLTALRQQGWSVYVLWECELRDQSWLKLLSGILGSPRTM